MSCSNPYPILFTEAAIAKAIHLSSYSHYPQSNLFSFWQPKMLRRCYMSVISLVKGHEFKSEVTSLKTKEYIHQENMIKYNKNVKVLVKRKKKKELYIIMKMVNQQLSI